VGESEGKDEAREKARRGIRGGEGKGDAREKARRVRRQGKAR
jgi:hypothetical protein